ncbi:MAG: hypothetical protein HYS45_00980 [Parcubacteria group bacterium]|nr:hypothetical protein [Parcubacteria group bacterium]
MSEKFIKKNIRLMHDFDGYTSRHLDVLMKIPNKGYVVMTDGKDADFNRISRSLVARIRNKKRIVEARKVGRSWRLYPYEKI